MKQVARNAEYRIPVDKRIGTYLYPKLYATNTVIKSSDGMIPQLSIRKPTVELLWEANDFRRFCNCAAVQQSSLYPTILGRRHGDPVADKYLVQIYENTTFVGLADGCGWGTRAKAAAEEAIAGLKEEVVGKLKNIKDTRQAAMLLLHGFHLADQKIRVGKPVWDVGTTSLLAGLLFQLRDIVGPSVQSAFVCCSIGNCKGFVHSKDGKVKEFTSGESSRNDTGGRLGPYVVDPQEDDMVSDVRNMAVYFVPINEGDIIVLTTQGIHSNMDPEYLGKTPMDFKIESQDWEGVPSNILHSIKSKSQSEIIKSLSKGKASPTSLAQSLVSHAWEITAKTRSYVENNADKKLPSPSSKFPGKLDHATCICFAVGKNEIGSYNVGNKKLEEIFDGIRVTGKNSQDAQKKLVKLGGLLERKFNPEDLKLSEGFDLSNNVCLYLFLKHHGTIKKTFKRIIQVQEWFTHVRPDFLEVQASAEVVKTGNLPIIGYDMSDSPVVVLFASLVVPDKDPEEWRTRMAYLIQRLEAALSYGIEVGSMHINLLIDFGKYTVKTNWNYPCIIELVTILRFYSERFKRVMLIGMTPLLLPLLKGHKIVPSHFTEGKLYKLRRIQVINGFLLQFIPPEQLPLAYGGTNHNSNLTEQQEDIIKGGITFHRLASAVYSEQPPRHYVDSTTSIMCQSPKRGKKKNWSKTKALRTKSELLNLKSRSNFVSMSDTNLSSPVEWEPTLPQSLFSFLVDDKSDDDERSKSYSFPSDDSSAHSLDISDSDFGEGNISCSADEKDKKIISDEVWNTEPMLQRSKTEPELTVSVKKIESKKIKAKSRSSRRVTNSVLDESYKTISKSVFLPKNKKKSKEKQQYNWEIPYSELEIFEELGSGAMGVVKKARWRGVNVAVKQMKTKDQYTSAEEIRAFLLEISIMSKLRHPNVVLFLGACLEFPEICLVTEYVEGGNVHDYLKLHPLLSFADRLKMVIDTAKGVNFLHLSDPVYLHQDLKGYNLLVDETGKVKVADFGITSVLEGNLGIERKTFGTLNWVAPEILDAEAPSTKSDVFSFAMVMWEIATGKIPYHGMTEIHILYSIMEEERPKIPEYLPTDYKNLIEKCWVTAPQKRPEFKEILVELTKIENSLLEKTRKKRALSCGHGSLRRVSSSTVLPVDRRKTLMSLETQRRNSAIGNKMFKDFRNISKSSGTTTRPTNLTLHTTTAIQLNPHTQSNTKQIDLNQATDSDNKYNNQQQPTNVKEQETQQNTCPESEKTLKTCQIKTKTKEKNEKEKTIKIKVEDYNDVLSKFDVLISALKTENITQPTKFALRDLITTLAKFDRPATETSQPQEEEILQHTQQQLKQQKLAQAQQAQLQAQQQTLAQQQAQLQAQQLQAQQAQQQTTTNNNLLDCKYN